MKKFKILSSMKCFLFVCCLLALPYSNTYAQSKAAKTQAPKTNNPSAQNKTAKQQGATNKSQAVQKVSKADFLLKVDELNKLFDQSKMDAAGAKWEEIQDLIHATFSIADQTFENMTNAGDEKGKESLLKIEGAQSNLYDKLTVLAANMQDNKAEMQKLLNEFAGNML